MKKKYSDITRSQLDVYGTSFREFGATPQGTKQNNVETQKLRFSRLVKEIIQEPSPSSIHDVGCGICDLHEYLNELGFRHYYSGTDIVPEMIREAKLRFPDADLREASFLDLNENDKFDFIVSSGTFNIPGATSSSDWNAHFLSMIRSMYQKANKGISFNCLSTNNTLQRSDVHYFNPIEVFEFCTREFSRFVTLDHAYPLFEFTITVFKPEFMMTKFTDPNLKKYFAMYGSK